MMESTKGFRNMFGREKQTMGNIAEGYLYGRWPNLYVYHIRRLVEKLVPDPETVPRYPGETIPPEIDELTQMCVEKMMPTLMSPETSIYHGKVLKLDEARALLTVDQDIALTDLERVIPYKHARDIILKNPDRIAVIDCPCRSSKGNSCKPMDVCLVVGEPFVSFILDHNKGNNPRKVSQDEAVDIIKAEDDRGHIHSAWFKDACGDRFYAVCNCCRCCCAPMKAHFNNVPIIAPSGYLCEINEECNGCGSCVEYCQFGALSMDGKPVVNEKKCMGCGVCESKCPVEAITLKRDPARCEPLDMGVLLKEKQSTSV
ncbi:MAG TPA: 4Fe-4S binding protein [Deltaproteobacteria bacterium]|nr:4Fe-4S binding protein [Deltaproteobacteria bacterium]